MLCSVSAAESATGVDGVVVVDLLVDWLIDWLMPCKPELQNRSLLVTVASINATMTYVS